MPLHGNLHGPRQHDPLPYGRRRPDLGWPGAIRKDRARLSEPWRWHVLPFGLSSHPRLRCGRGQYHLQDPFQRCCRHDRRATRRRTAYGCRHRPPGGGGRGLARCCGQRRAGQISHRHGISRRHAHRAPPFPGQGAAQLTRDRRRQRADLRPDLCRREAASAQARTHRRPVAAGLHQRARLRGLRRLQRQVQLHVRVAREHAVWAQAAHRPVGLQQGLFLCRGLLPEFRQYHWWEAAPRRDGCRATVASGRSAGVDIDTARH